MHQHVFSIITRYSRGVRRASLVLLLTLSAAACARDALLSPDGARPHATGAPLVSVTPGSALVGDTGVVLTIRGSGFTDWSLVQIDPWLPVSVTFVDNSTLTARIEAPLWEANTHQVSVSTDWESSDQLPFVVANPVPVITRLSPEWCEVGSDCHTVTLDNETSNHRYRTMQVDDDGVTLVSTMWSGLSAPAGIVFAGGRLYNSGGPTLDAGYNDWAGGFYTLSGAVQPDLATGRAFFLGDDAIRVGDINTFALLGTLSVPPLLFDDPAVDRRHLVRWGADGLAWHDADEVFLLRSPLVGQ